MRSLSVYLAFMASLVLTVSSADLYPIPHEGLYLDSNTAGLGHNPPTVDIETVDNILGVLTKYGLNKDFGVYLLHQHLHHHGGEVPYESGDKVHLKTTIRKFSDIKDNAAPYIYRVASANDGLQLQPLTYGPITNNVKASRITLAHAIDKGFLDDLSPTLHGQDVIGIGLVLDIHRTALAHGMIVTNSVKNNETVLDANILPETNLESAKNAITFYTRGVASDNQLEHTLACPPSCWAPDD